MIDCKKMKGTIGVLDESVSHVKGIGEKSEELLASMGIHSISDLLEYFPVRYEMFEMKPLAELNHQEKVTIIGKVMSDPVLQFYRRRKSRISFLFEVEGIPIRVVIFNRPYLQQQIKKDDVYTFTGKWDQHRLQITVQHYQKGSVQQTTDIQPIYSGKGHLTSTRLKFMIRQALKQYGNFVEEILPTSFLKMYKLPDRKTAIFMIHQPNSKEALKHAKRRLVYEEFLLFQLKMQLLRKYRRKEVKGLAQNYNQNKVENFINSLPFQLTDAQKRVVSEILQDMKSPFQMNRLLQGDVGSGKTVVAAISLYAAVTAGNQTALMVPTEILAEQHYQSLKEIFHNQMNIELLTGSVQGKKRKEILEQVENHEINLLIGTHALIQEPVQFDQLGLVIIDEQHRFGVQQRRKLRSKGSQPDVLFMTATPIPRTLAITSFGDMDVSIIDELPSGRKKIETYWVKENMLERILKFIDDRVQKGEQAYVICPLIEESDKLDIQNAIDVYEMLRQYFKGHISIGLMHGRLSSKDKDEVMQAFVQKRIQVLVSTTVVEVGVNVPNATVMVIYDADRFGLSQLHQLRGRVGRGDLQSYCILIADAKSEQSRERMKIMVETDDGFRLAEEDLKLRGAGDFFGEKQSGLPEFKIADMIQDYRALETARKDAAAIVSRNLLETDPSYRMLSKALAIERFLQEKLD